MQQLNSLTIENPMAMLIGFYWVQFGIFPKSFLHFLLGDDINKQNCLRRDLSNIKEFLERPLYTEKVIILCEY